MLDGIKKVVFCQYHYQTTTSQDPMYSVDTQFVLPNFLITVVMVFTTLFTKGLSVDTTTSDM